MTSYLCHDCGNRLETIIAGRVLWCRFCRKRRRVPTHPALVVTDAVFLNRPEGELHDWPRRNDGTYLKIPRPAEHEQGHR